MAPELKPIDPKSPRWEPTPDPNDITVPGLDTTAPPYDQIEQIEQLITIKLQNIDANFSKIQHVMANRILPAVKRYAVGTQPVREAAKFWTTFYEQAAQIRIPTYDDYGAGQEPTEEEAETTQGDSEADHTEQSAHSSDSESEAEPLHHVNRTYKSDTTSSEVSFAPGQAAVSSTPATVSRTRFKNPQDSFTSQGSDAMPSWSASLESPLMQLNRDIQSLSEDRSIAALPAPELEQADSYDASEDTTQRAIRPEHSQKEPSVLQSQNKGKDQEGPQPLLHNVLRRNANSSIITASSSRTTSPLKFKPKTPVLKSLNPFVPPDTNSSDWIGVVDLKDPAVASPQRNVPASSIKLSAFKRPAAIGGGFGRTRTKTPPPGEDDSFDENFGMSPPVMTDYARLPKLGKTPRKEAAERIMQNLLDVERRGIFGPAGTASKRAAGAGQGKGTGGGYGTESSMSSMPTPPSMTRYTRSPYVPPVTSETSSSVADASLDSIMRRVGLSVPGYSSVQVVPAPASPPPAPVFQAPRPPVFTSISSTSATSSLASSTRSTVSTASSRTLQPPPLLQSESSIRTPEPPQYDYYDDEVIGRGPIGGDADDSIDSLDYEDQDTAQAPADFLFAAQDNTFDDEDDSFDSDMGDPTDGTAPPFIVSDDGDGAFDDDSFDDPVYAEGEEETVFGVPPAQRLQQQQALAQGQLRMLGEDLLQETIGIGTQMTLAGRVEESPTPWNNQGRS